jgi:hypothetical protein
VDYSCETFQTETGGLRHNDIAKYGTYRTKDLVLAVYDVMVAAAAAGTPYKSPLTPSPGQGPATAPVESQGWRWMPGIAQQRALNPRVRWQGVPLSGDSPDLLLRCWASEPNEMSRSPATCPSGSLTTSGLTRA